MKVTKLILLLVSLMVASPTMAQRPEIGMEQFESWIFQGVANRNDYKSLLESRLDLEITRISQTITLDDEQIARLKLAGRGDVKRFYDRVERARTEFLAMREQLDQNKINEVYQLAVPLQQELQKGLFGKSSLLRKVVATTVDDEQTAKMKEESERQLRVKKENAVKAYLVNLGRQMPMTAAQRTKLTELLLQHMKSIGREDVYVNYLVMYRISEVPRETYESLFDEKQMKVLDQASQQGKGMKAMLKQQGLLDDEP